MIDFMFDITGNGRESGHKYHSRTPLLLTRMIETRVSEGPLTGGNETLPRTVYCLALMTETRKTISLLRQAILAQYVASLCVRVCGSVCHNPVFCLMSETAERIRLVEWFLAQRLSSACPIVCRISPKMTPLSVAMTTYRTAKR